jgi:hypothetical protein
LIGGAAVVVAGVTECVALLDVPLLDESVVMDADWEGDCVCVCDDAAVVESDGDEVIEEEVVSGVVTGVEVEVMVVSVVANAEDTAEDAAEDAAEDDIDTPTLVPVKEPEPTAEVAEVAEVAEEEAADTGIKLPPLLNSVTVVGCPLTTTVDTVTVLCGPALPTPLLNPLAALLRLVCTLVSIVFVVCTNENEYVVIGSKEAGNVSNADESTESALVVCGGSPVTLVGRVVMVVYCVVAAVVWMGMITARVREGGISTVAVGRS